MQEIGSIFVQNTKRRWIIGCISTLVGLPVMGGCLLLLFTGVFPILDNLAAGGNGNLPTLGIVGIGLIIIIGLIAIPLVAGLVIIQRNARSLDAVFKPLGLTGRAYMLFGRQYLGQIGGREVDVYIYRGPTIEIRLKTAIMTRVQIVLKGSLNATIARAFSKEPIVTNDTVLEAFYIYALDETWTRDLLAASQTGETIKTLMTIGATWAIFRRVEFQPGELVFNLYRSRRTFASPIESGAARAWLSALQTLAKIAENQPAPQITSLPSGSPSRQSRQGTSKILIYTVAFLVFFMPLCFIGIGVLAFLIIQ